MKPLIRPLVSALLVLGAFSAIPSRVAAQFVQPTTPPWRWLWIGGDNPLDTWGSANSRNAGALTGNWLVFPGVVPAPPITRPRTGSDLVVIDPAQSSQGTLGETITGELNCRMEPQAGWTVGRAELAAGTSLTLQGNSTLTITTTPATGFATFSGAGNVDNRGDIRINAGGTLAMAVPGTISGSGTITMSPSDGTFGESSLGGNNSNVTFSIAAGQTVRGAGLIRGGANFAANLNNGGLIDANVAGRTLAIFIGNSTNSGILRASNGGTLRFYNPQGGTLNNANARIEALAGSTVRIDNLVTVEGGTLATTGSGEIRGSGGGNYLRNVTNTGLLQLGDNSSIEFAVLLDGFTNSGTVRVGGTNFTASNLLFQTNITLNGGGRITLSANGDKNICALAPNLTLTNPAGATIDGTGGMGNNAGGFGGLGNPAFFAIANAGLIDANVPARALSIRAWDTANSRVTNTGTLRASGGGILALTGIDANNLGTFENTNGRLEALDGSVVQIGSGAQITGGTIATSGTGVIRVGQNAVFSGGVLRDVTSTGKVELSFGVFAGQILNTGTMTLAAASLALSSANVLNQGGATFALVAGTQLTGSGTFTNAGTFTRSGTSFSTMQTGVAFVNTGSVVIDASLCQFGNFSQSAGSLRFTNGGSTQTASGQPLVFTGGRIEGTGTFQTAVANNGTLSIGSTDGTPTALNFASYTQAANATLNLNVGGTATGAFGMLNVSGTATLAGTVNVQLVSGFRFRVGDSLRLVSAGSVAGSFGTVNLPAGVTGSLATSGGNVTLTITAAPAATSLVNISTRARIEAGDNVLIGGFVIGGSAPKRVIIRAIGPSLTPFGVTGALSNPTLRLVAVGSPNDLASNDNWKSSQQAEIQASGFAPTNDNESAIIATLPPGSYTAIVAGVGGESGIGLVEVYDLDRGSRETARPLNVSTRARVLTNDSILIGGFVVEGARERRVLIRAIGPSLTAFGVPGALSNPTLEIKNAGGTTIGTNDQWKSAQQTEIQASGFAPTNDNESAIVLTLPPGAYTALVSGVNGTTGVGLVEVYDLE